MVVLSFFARRLLWRLGLRWALSLITVTPVVLQILTWLG